MSEQNAPTPAEIREEIEQTRADLGETVDALAQKLDVKAQVKHRVDDVKTTVSDAAGRAKESTPAPVQHALDRAAEAAAPVADQVRPYRKQILIGIAATVGVVVLWRRRSS